jgi:hypothetical protein
VVGRGRTEIHRGENEIFQGKRKPQEVGKTKETLPEETTK